MDNVHESASTKRNQRGSFSQGIILETVSEDSHIDLEDDWTTTAQGEQSEGR